MIELSLGTQFVDPSAPDAAISATLIAAALIAAAASLFLHGATPARGAHDARRRGHGWSLILMLDAVMMLGTAIALLVL